jgi:CRP/FNR family cyclic AMP-dependent transcriptional regulator
MLNLDDRKKFAQEVSRTFESGEIIFNEGDDSREMYIVVSGEVEVIKKAKSGEIHLAKLQKGDFVGEMSLLESLPRSATARSVGQTKLLVIQPCGFLLKIRRDPTFAFEMLQSLSRRIRLTNESLVRELGHEKVSADTIQKIVNGSEFSNTSEDQKS